MKLNKDFLKYVLILLVVYVVLDYGTYAFIGITTPDGKYYVSFFDEYFNYVKVLRLIILAGSQFWMSVLGYETYLQDAYTIKVVNGASVRLVYSCLGYGVISFWIAFIAANQVNIYFKLKWLVIGIFFIIFSNTIRISFLLIANENKWPKVFNIDHHTVYNIINYVLLIILIFIFQNQLTKMKKD